MVTAEDRVLFRLQTGAMPLSWFRGFAELNALCNLTRKGLARYEGGRYRLTAEGDRQASQLAAADAARAGAL